MKIAFFAIAVSLLATLNTGATELTREQAGSMQSYDLEKLKEKEPTLAGKIVRLKFNYRSTRVEKKDDGSLEGRIHLYKFQPNFAGYESKYGSREVRVPAEGVEWFLKLSSKESRASLLVYARIPASTDEPAELLGREIKTDLKGSRIVW